MATKTEATVADLYRTVDRGKAELVHGEIVMMPPTGGLPGYATGEIFASLRTYAREQKNGYAVGDNVGFVVDLPHRKSFSPDAAFHAGKLSMQFVEGAPRFAVEVRSEGDYGPTADRDLADERAEKRADYFAAGTLVVWDVDLLHEDVVRVYRANAPETPTCFRRGQDAEAEPAVPGWRMAVNDLFPE
jgi:Uma2 family endonuclease